METPKQGRNAAKCLECDTYIESKSRYDFVQCGCGAIFVDGDRDYYRFGWTEGKEFEYYGATEPPAND